MWDVKSNTICQRLPVVLEFYLNYVGCKVRKIRNKQIEQIKFYLNYVGCKGMERCPSGLRCLGFTLTMWDVKPFFDKYTMTYLPVLP